MLIVLDFQYLHLFTLIVLQFTDHSTTPSQRQGKSLSGSALAFLVAVAGSAAANTWGFGNRLPQEPEEVVVFLATLSLTIVAAWWSVNVLAWTWALRSGITLARFTLPGSKRVAQILLAASLSTACVAEGSPSPSMVLIEAGQTLTSPATVIDTDDDDDVALITNTSTPTSTTAAPTTSTPNPTEVAAEVFAPGILRSADNDTSQEDAGHTGIVEHQVVVNHGDNLWSLAAETLTLSGVEQPTCQRISEYWRLVVATNQVRSGNSDLIVAGETITMPAFPLAPSSPSPGHHTHQ